MRSVVENMPDLKGGKVNFDHVTATVIKSDGSTKKFLLDGNSEDI
jgi:hypothetical protein